MGETGTLSWAPPGTAAQLAGMVRVLCCHRVTLPLPLRRSSAPAPPLAGCQREARGPAAVGVPLPGAHLLDNREDRLVEHLLLVGVRPKHLERAA